MFGFILFYNEHELLKRKLKKKKEDWRLDGGKYLLNAKLWLLWLRQTQLFQVSISELRKILSDYQHSHSCYSGSLPHKHSAQPLRSLQPLCLTPSCPPRENSPATHLSTRLCTVPLLWDSFLHVLMHRLYLLKYYFYSTAPFFKDTLDPTPLSWIPNSTLKQGGFRKSETVALFNFNPSHPFTQIMEQECNLKLSLQTLSFPVAHPVKDLPAIGKPRFDPWVGKIPWRRERLLTPVSWPREFHGLYSPWGHKESDTTEQLSLHYKTLGNVFWRNETQKEPSTQKCSEHVVCNKGGTLKISDNKTKVLDAIFPFIEIRQPLQVMFMKNLPWLRMRVLDWRCLFQILCSRISELCGREWII